MRPCEFCKTVKNTVFTDHLGTPAPVFTEYVCNITKLKTLLNIEMYTCEIKIT